MIVLNLFGGPGSGKSTIAHGLMYLFKTKNYHVEYSAEYAKELVYSNDMFTLSDQFNILREQERRLSILNNKVDIVINEAPLINSMVYVKPEQKDKMVYRSLKLWNQYNNISFFIKRNPNLKYVEKGRIHSLGESQELDKNILNMLNLYDPNFKIVETSEKSLDIILNHYEKHILDNIKNSI